MNLKCQGYYLKLGTFLIINRSSNETTGYPSPTSFGTIQALTMLHGFSLKTPRPIGWVAKVIEACVSIKVPLPKRTLHQTKYIPRQLVATTG